MRGLGQIEIISATGNALVDSYMIKVDLLRKMVFSNTGLSRAINQISEMLEGAQKQQLQDIRNENLSLLNDYISPLIDKFIKYHDKILPKVKSYFGFSGMGIIPFVGVGVLSLSVFTADYVLNKLIGYMKERNREIAEDIAEFRAEMVQSGKGEVVAAIDQTMVVYEQVVSQYEDEMVTMKVSNRKKNLIIFGSLAGISYLGYRKFFKKG